MASCLEPGGLFDGPFGSSLKTSDYTESGVRVIRLENLSNLRFVAEKNTFISHAKYAGLKKHTVVEGDLLVGSFIDGAMRVCIVPRLDTVAIAKADCFCVRPRRDVIDPRYLAYQLGASRTHDALIEEIHGATRPRVTTKQLRGFNVLVCPIPEQRRIVAKVEALLARVNAARQRLANVPAILKRFRQSVLAAACSGRLTADWREEQTRLEPTSALIKRSEAKRERPFRQVDEAELPGIPECWSWVYLPDLGYMNRGKSRHRPRNAPHLYGGHYPFIQTGDIAQSGGRITAHKQNYSEAGLAQSRLWPAGTICITIAANIADSAILTYPACFPDSVVGLIPEPELCVTEYAEFFIRTARDDLSQFAPATAQKNINIAILNDVAVPLPPHTEQHEVVRRVEALFRLTDDIEKRLAVATARAEKLTQAILTKAFRGELVPTEAELARQEGRDYEPASVLLERIRADRALANAATKESARLSPLRPKRPRRPP
jgi:type I restriction enzyme S subunit